MNASFFATSSRSVPQHAMNRVHRSEIQDDDLHRLHHKTLEVAFEPQGLVLRCQGSACGQEYRDIRVALRPCLSTYHATVEVGCLDGRLRPEEPTQRLCFVSLLHDNPPSRTRQRGRTTGPGSTRPAERAPSIG
jgi:hypothetical protein